MTELYQELLALIHEHPELVPGILADLQRLTDEKNEQEEQRP